MISELLTSALKTLGKPVYRLARTPKGSQNRISPESYITFQTVLIQPNGYADDDNTTTLHTFRVNLYSKVDFTQLLINIISVLKQAGFTISTVDAEMYENDTGYYHVPITIKYLEECKNGNSRT